MSRILAVGSSPTLLEKEVIGTAFGLRTWHLIKPLLDNGHHVDLYMIAHPEKYPKTHPIHTKATHQVDIQNDIYRDFLEYLSLCTVTLINKDQTNPSKILQNAYKNHTPDMILGINMPPSYYASQIKSEKPFWADLNGWSMVEAQAQAAVWEDDAMIPKVWNMEKQIVKTADVISTVSVPQAYATIGELASLGRLNQNTTSWDFTYTIENATDMWTFRKLKKDLQDEDSTILQDIGYTKDQKIVLSIGAYNTWVDTDTLIYSIKKLLRKNPYAIYVHTGEGIPGISKQEYEAFKNRLMQSEYQDRIHLLGWVSRGDLSSLLQHASIGINIDLPVYETFFGARNRINEYLAHELLTASTPGSQIADTLIEKHGTIPLKSHDPDQIASQLDFYLHDDNKSEAEHIRQTGVNINETIYSFEHTTQNLQAFCENPKKAPDYHYKLRLQNSIARQGIAYLKKNGIKRTCHKVLGAVKRKV